jgi:hypothetical protein
MYKVKMPFGPEPSGAKSTPPRLGFVIMVSPLFACAQPPCLARARRPTGPYCRSNPLGNAAAAGENQRRSRIGLRLAQCEQRVLRIVAHPHLGHINVGIGDGLPCPVHACGALAAAANFPVARSESLRTTGGRCLNITTVSYYAGPISRTYRNYVEPLKRCSLWGSA